MYFVKVTDTTGHSVNVAVVTTMSAKFVHTPLNVWAEENYGKFCTVEYVTQIAVPDVQVPFDFPVGRILDLDNI